MKSEKIKIFLSGDFYGGDRAGSRLENRFEAGEFNEVFEGFTNIIQENDIAVTNLESPVISTGEPAIKTGPVLKASPATIEALKFAGFNLVTLANNHILDYGPEALNETINLLDRNKIDHIGASTDSDLAPLPYIYELKTKRIAFLNFAENEWIRSSLNGRNSGANPLDPISNHYSILETKKKADYLIVILHGGNEYYDLPNPRTKKLCRFYIDSGADLVVCHHAHYYSGFEDYSGGRIYYGLGNFLFDKPQNTDASWNRGIAVQVTITEEQVEHSIIPYKQCEKLPRLELLNQDEDHEFQKNLSRLGEIIRDDEKLQQHFDSFVQSKRNQYESFLQPYNGKFRSLYKRGLLPSLHSQTYYTLLLNLIRCESHRDVILKILSEKVDKLNLKK